MLTKSPPIIIVGPYFEIRFQIELTSADVTGPTFFMTN
jgi:hypothetical protein